MSDTPWWDGLECVQVIGGSAYGGGVPVVLAVMDATERLGMRPVLLATHPDVVEAAESAGREVWRFPGIVRRPRPLRDLWTAARLSFALRRRGVRIVHTHTSKGGMVGRLAAWLAGCDVVIHHTHGFYHAGLPSGIRRWVMVNLERLFGRLDDVQVFINSAEFNESVEAGIARPRQARLCFNGVAEPRSAHLPPREVRNLFNLPTNGPLVGSVCRIDFEQKGLDTGLAAFEQVHRAVPEARWVIAGTGDDSAALASMIAERGLTEDVIMLGSVSDGASLHRALDVTFAPSRREGQSVTVLEAMACATPVVTTRIPGNVDLVADGESGMLVEVGDVEAMSEALVGVLRDGVARERMGRVARERYESLFTREHMIERLQTLYVGALSGHDASEPVVTPMQTAHVADVVAVHMAAFPAFFLTQLGRPFLRAYYSRLVRDPASIAFVAMQGGHVLGFVAGAACPGGFYGRLLRRGWLQFGLAALLGVVRRPSSLGRVIRALKKPGESEPAADVAGLFSFGVDPARQNSGIGSELLERFAQAAREAGCTRVRLETDADDNEAVNAFYCGKGFSVVRRYATTEGRRMLEYEMSLTDRAMR